MRYPVLSVMVAALLAAITIGHLTGQQPTAKENEDTAAIQKASQSFLKAYIAGDAKAMAAHWTEKGEYYSEDGTVLRGRDAIEKAYREIFTKKAGLTDAEIDVTSIRFPSKGMAIEEGYFKVRVDKEPVTSSKYTVLHVREDGKWLMAVVREYPSEGIQIRDLEWLIGAWETKGGDTEVLTKYEWWGEKSYIRVHITLKHKGRTREGMQMIGKDSSTGVLRSWTFDAEGAFAEANWTRDGKKWVQASTGVLEDGSVLAATNILTRLDDNTFTFQSVERTLNDEGIEDVPPVRIVRVTGK